MTIHVARISQTFWFLLRSFLLSGGGTLSGIAHSLIAASVLFRPLADILDELLHRGDLGGFMDRGDMIVGVVDFFPL